MPRAKSIAQDDVTLAIQDEEISKEFSNYLEKILNKLFRNADKEHDMILMAEPHIETPSLQNTIIKLKEQ